MSQSALSAPTFASCALAPTTISSVIVGGQMVAMQRWLVREGGPLCGRTVAEVLDRHRLGVIEHLEPGSEAIIYPRPDVRLEAGDGLLLQGPVEVLETLRAQLETAIAG